MDIAIEIDIVAAGKLHDLVRRFAHGQQALHGKPFAAQFLRAAFKIRSIHLDFFALGKIELFKVPRNPAIRNMHEQQPRPHEFGERLDVIQDGLVCLGYSRREQDIPGPWLEGR